MPPPAQWQTKNTVCGRLGAGELVRQTRHIAAVMRSSMTGCDVSDTRGTASPASQICVKIAQRGRQLCAKRANLRSGKSLMLTSRLCYWERKYGANTEQPEIKNRKWVNWVPLLGNDEMKCVSTLRCNHERLSLIKVLKLYATTSFQT